MDELFNTESNRAAFNFVFKNELKNIKMTEEEIDDRIVMLMEEIKANEEENIQMEKEIKELENKRSSTDIK
jgi:predicted  nucleic acid-binding Zn-ribbon protein